MNSQPAYNTHTHVVDILGNVKGRDHPIMLMSKAIELVTTLDAEVFLDDDVVFFDPFCKAGEILLACAFSSCRAKFELVPELFTEEAFKKQVKNELYHSNRYFALAPDERHHRLSLRTFLGNENSHNQQFNHIIRNGNYVSEIDGKLNRDKFEQEFLSMLEHIKSTSGEKKIIAVGNPPYQESDGGAQKSAKPIYQIFVNSLINHCQINEFVLVIPARWFAGGKGLDSFRESTINSKNVKSLKYFAKSGEVFPTVDIDGGICFFHWDEINNSKPEFIVDEKRQKIDLSEYDIIPDDPGAYEILHKIRSKWNGKWVSDVAWSRKPFGLSTDYFKKNNSIDPSKFEDAVMCIGRARSTNYVRENDVSNNIEHLGDYKVCIPGAYGGKKGQRRKTLPANQVFIVEPGAITTETYMVIDSLESRELAENLVCFLGTDFSRYLLGLRKITQHIPKDRWNWVPYMDVNRQWTDQDLFDYFNITPEEQQHIKNKVKEWS